MNDDPYTIRLEIVRQFISIFKSEFRQKFSLGLCGSMALGTPNENSDVDIIIIIHPNDFAKALSCGIIRKTAPIINNIISDAFTQLKYHIYRLIHIQYRGVFLSVEFLSLPLCYRLINLEEFDIKKFYSKSLDNIALHYKEYKLPKVQQTVDYYSKMQREREVILRYRGFNHSKGQKTIDYKSKIHEENDGFYSILKSCIKSNNEIFVHYYIDKLFTLNILTDDYNVTECQNALRSKLYEEFQKSNHTEFLGFLHQYDFATKDQLKKLRITNSFNIQLRKMFFEEVQRLSRNILILCGPTGVGKDTIADELIKKNSWYKYHISISTGKEKKRSNNRRYYFVSCADFITRKQEGDFIFWNYFGDSSDGTPIYYGLTFENLIFDLNNYSLVILPLGLSGAVYFKTMFPECKTIAIHPESIDQLQLQNSDRSKYAINDFDNRKSHILSYKEFSPFFDHNIVNRYNQLESTVLQIMQIIENQ